MERAPTNMAAKTNSAEALSEGDFSLVSGLTRC